MQKNEVRKMESIVREDIKTNFSSGQSLIPKHFIDLYIRPKKFFLSQIALGRTPYILFITWIVGISSAIDRVNKQLMKAEYGSRPELNEVLKYIVDSWLSFWPFVLLMGSIAAAFLWAVGGWWYNVRIKWSGAGDHDRKTGRIIYIYTSFIYAFPSVLLVLTYNLLYPSYRMAFNADEWYSMIILIFPFWSVINSYKAVSNVFGINNLKVKLWFLILPVILFIIAFGIIAWIAAFVQNI